MGDYLVALRVIPAEAGVHDQKYLLTIARLRYSYSRITMRGQSAALSPRQCLSFFTSYTQAFPGDYSTLCKQPGYSRNITDISMSIVVNQDLTKT